MSISSGSLRVAVCGALWLASAAQALPAVGDSAGLGATPGLVVPAAPPVAAPVFSPPSGAAATNWLSVTLYCATEGATIRYTLDGSEPTAASACYTGVVGVTHSAVVKAKAFMAGMPDSDTETASYTVFVPDFDIVDVRVLCRAEDGAYRADRFQPLDTDRVGVEARVANMRYAPSNIQMCVAYYVGTNRWGADNWPPEQTVTRPMYPTAEDPLVYRTLPDNDIPRHMRNQVVQYRVRADYQTGFVRVKNQQAFANPAWYFPVDLNACHAAQGWSPYYFVYDAPLGAVWINEVNAIDFVYANGSQVFSVGDNPYIEIAVPAWMDLEGWSVDLVNHAYQTRTLTIPFGLQPMEPATNGYAFFVIGDATPHPNAPPLPKLDYAFQNLADEIPWILPGGLRLKRPMGMYEQAIAYDWNAAYGGSYDGNQWPAGDPQHRFAYVGREHNGGSLARAGVTDSTNAWCFPQRWTPGEPNVGQQYAWDGISLEHMQDVFVTSVLKCDRGTQNGVRQKYRLIIRKGTSTNICFKADDWYRVTSLKKDGVECMPAGTESGAYLLPLEDVSQHMNLEADFQVCRELAELEGADSGYMSWIFSFAEGPLVPMLHNGRPLNLHEQCWLGVNPTVSNTFDFAITRFLIDQGSNLHLTLRMAVNGAKMTALPGTVLKLQAKASLSDPEWTLLGQYSLTGDSFDDARQCNLTVPNPFAFILADVDPKRLFFRWLIETQDLRVGIRPLVAGSAP